MMSEQHGTGETARDGDALMNTLYQELRKLAHARMRKLAPGHTLQPTALVHEVYLRMQKNPDVQWNGRRHFFGAAARAMREVLIDSARRKSARKHGGDMVQVDMPFSLMADASPMASPMSPAALVDLHRALEDMQASYPEHAEVVLLHCFAGLSLDEAGQLMGLARRTLMRRWRFARAWLFEQMSS
jgi:RNA polymerase sigma factor (TIGR02999 family)